jgi:hypothetical protein
VAAEDAVAAEVVVAAGVAVDIAFTQADTAVAGDFAAAGAFAPAAYRGAADRASVFVHSAAIGTSGALSGLVPAFRAQAGV